MTKTTRTKRTGTWAVALVAGAAFGAVALPVFGDVLYSSYPDERARAGEWAPGAKAGEPGNWYQNPGNWYQSDSRHGADWHQQGTGLTVPDFVGANPSIPSPGYPDFWSLNLSASLTSNAAGTVYTLTIQGSDPNIGIFNFPSGAYLVQNEKVELTAHFSSTGQLLTSLPNTYEIEGSLAPSRDPTFGSRPGGVYWTRQPFEVLFSADLSAATVDLAGDALGFQSTNFGGWANQSQFTGGDTSESVWLYSLLSGVGSKNGADAVLDWKKQQSSWNTFLTELADHTKLEPGRFFGIGSIATVPLPGALWLLGSGLLGLGSWFRRRHRRV